MIGRALTALTRLTNANVADGMTARADLARSLGHFRDAGILYEEVLRLEPVRVAIRVQCAHMFKEAGDLPRAWTHYAEASVTLTHDADFHLQLGHFFKIAGRLEDAGASYRRASTLRFNWEEPLQELGRLGHDASESPAGTPSGLSSGTASAAVSRR